MALDATTQFIVDLFLLLGSAVLAGEIAAHLGQPALVGQLLTGLVLGPSLLGKYVGLTIVPGSSSALTPQLSGLQFLATVFILFMAGLEVVPEKLYRIGTSTILLGLGVFFVPFLVSALLVPIVMPWISVSTALLVAVTLSITALPVMGIMVSEFGLTRTKLGDLLMSVALVNELTAVTTFAVLQRLFSGTPTPGGELVSGAVALVSVGLFILTLLSIHMVLRVLRDTRRWEPIRQAFTRTWRSKQGNFALLMVMVVGSTLLSQYLGLTYVVGAFFAGLLVNRETTGEVAHRSISNIFDAMTWGFFVPLFFAFVGVEMYLEELDHPIWILAFAILLVVAIASKLVVGTAGASLIGLKDTDAKAIGFMVGSRGAVELAMATILLSSGLIDAAVFTLIAAVGLITTIIAPVGALNAWLSDPRSREELFNRLPELRRESTATRHLRPPMSWEEMRALYSRETAWPLLPIEKPFPLEAFHAPVPAASVSASPVPAATPSVEVPLGESPEVRPPLPRNRSPPYE